MKQVLKNRAFALTVAALLAAVLAVIGIAAQDAPKVDAPKVDAPEVDAPEATAAKPQDRIVVRLVAAEMPAKLISELEVISSIEDPTFDSASRSNTARRPSLGDDATLWVRGASVDGVHGFERTTMQDGKEYCLFRKAELELKVDLAVPPPAAPASAAPKPGAPAP